jgi:hypothetical protein
MRLFFFIKMNLVAAHCQRSKDLWLRVLAECQQRKVDDLITTCYNNSKYSFIQKPFFYYKNS